MRHIERFVKDPRQGGAFEGEWYPNAVIENHIARGKRVCIVSPELHKRPHLALWDRLKPLSREENLMLCTDLPEEATAFSARRKRVPST